MQPGFAMDVKIEHMESTVSTTKDGGGGPPLGPIVTIVIKGIKDKAGGHPHMPPTDCNKTPGKACGDRPDAAASQQ